MPRTLFGSDTPSLTAMQFAVYTGGLPYSKLSYLCEPGAWKLRSMQSTIRNLTAKGFLADERLAVTNHQNARVLTPTLYTFDELSENTLFVGSEAWFRRQRKMVGRHITSNAASVQQRRKTIMRMLSTADEVLFTKYTFMLLDSLQKDANTKNMITEMQDKYPALKARSFENSAHILPGTKPDIHHAQLGNDICYMTAYELKSEMEKYRVRAEAGRAQGYVFSGLYDELTCLGGYNLTFYSMSRASMEMKAGHENDTRNLVNSVLQKNGNGHLNGDIILAPQGIFTDILVKRPLTGEVAREREGRSPYYIDLNRKSAQSSRTWFIPYTDDGAKILAMLLSPCGEDTLRLLPMVGKQVITDSSMTVINDFYDSRDRTFYLSFLVPDLYRLKKFMTAARSYPEDRFVVVCYKPYLDSLMEYAENMSEHNNIRFEPLSLKEIFLKFKLTRPVVQEKRIEQALHRYSR